MKKLLRVSLLTTLLFGLTHQSYAVLPFSLGFKGGVNLGDLSLDPDPYAGLGLTKSRRLGMSFGVVAEIGVGGPIYIAIEPSYVQKGLKLEATGGKATFEGDYVAIPLLLKAKFGSPRVKGFVFAGPNIGLRLSLKLVAEAQGQTQELDLKDVTKSTDFGADFGAGVEFALAKLIALTVDGRYSLGLSDLNNEANIPTKIKTNGIQILMGLLFTI